MYNAGSILQFRVRRKYRTNLLVFVWCVTNICTWGMLSLRCAILCRQHCKKYKLQQCVVENGRFRFLRWNVASWLARGYREGKASPRVLVMRRDMVSLLYIACHFTNHSWRWCIHRTFLDSASKRRCGVRRLYLAKTGRNLWSST